MAQMNLRTAFPIEHSPVKIDHTDSVMFVGSCFASSVGAMMEKGKIPVMINPSGTVYNPVSVGTTIDQLITARKFTEDDLYCHNGLWLSFNHYTEFSSDSAPETLDKINARLSEASDFLRKASFLFITFGTARIYRFRQTGKIVSNCHKIPSGQFSQELLKVSEITELWVKLLDRITESFPSLKVVFTISPVRHIKDGAHGNQLSKSTLFLAVEDLLSHPSHPGYFPAYEIMMDDLRDYRFYDDDMLHPSSSAINYIWEKFTDSWLSPATLKLWEDISSIRAGMAHRFNNGSEKDRIRFAESMLSRISKLETTAPGIDFTAEKSWFNNYIQRSGL
jgi:hypothetical protein